MIDILKNWLLGWPIICKLTKHKRGVRLAPTAPPHEPGDQNVKRYRCPRCGAMHLRKMKKERMA